MVQTPSKNDTFFGLDISEARKTFLNLRRKISKRYFLIEFGNDSLTYGEARVSKDQVFCSKINRISIEKAAIERGTPTDADVMGSFLTEIIEEEQIWAHRVGVILPPQSALSKIIYLPEQLNYNEAIDYVSNPSSSGFQFPISIENTDFDLIPLNCLPTNEINHTKPYFLTSIPKKLIDNIIKTLSVANLELHSLDVAFSSLERLAITSINKLKENQVFLLIELSLECTHLYIIGFSGPIHICTLAAIRAFETQENYQGQLSIEENTINNEDYLAISELDLKVLFNELNDELEKFNRKYDLEIREIILSGINSSHPGINNLFIDRFKINSTVLRSIASTDIGDVSLSKPIVMQDLNRLVGLGLNMVQADEINYEDLSHISTKAKEENTTKFESSKQIKSIDLSRSIEEYSDTSKNDYLNNQITNNNVLNNNLNELKSKNNAEKIIIDSSNRLSFDDFLKNSIKEKTDLLNNSNNYIKDTINKKNNTTKEKSMLDIDSNLQNKTIASSSNQNSTIESIDDDSESFVIDQNKDKDESTLDFDFNLQDKTIASSSNQNSTIESIEDDDDYDFNMP